MTLTSVSPTKKIIIPKTVRDNMGLQPYDWVEFRADTYSTIVSRLLRERPGNARKIAESAPDYDSAGYVAEISNAAEIAIPVPLYKHLSLETGSIVGLFRDCEGYRFIPIYNPTRYGKQTGSVDQGGIQIPENAIMELAVQDTKEARRWLYYGWEDIVRYGSDDPFLNVNEPESDAAFSEQITRNDPAFHH